jgi:hypothetical protein
VTARRSVAGGLLSLFLGAIVLDFEQAAQGVQALSTDALPCEGWGAACLRMIPPSVPASREMPLCAGTRWATP